MKLPFIHNWQFIISVFDIRFVTQSLPFRVSCINAMLVLFSFFKKENETYWKYLMRSLIGNWSERIDLYHVIRDTNHRLIHHNFLSGVISILGAFRTFFPRFCAASVPGNYDYRKFRSTDYILLGVIVGFPIKFRMRKKKKLGCCFI